MKISEYFGAALLFITVATQCESLSNIHITGTAIRYSPSSNDYVALEDGFLVVHCEEKSNSITDVFVKVKLQSNFLCYVNEKYPLSKSVYDECNNIMKIRVEEHPESGGYRNLSFAFRTPWLNYQPRKDCRHCRVCYCAKPSSNDSRGVTLSPLSWPKPAIIKKCYLYDYSDINCEWVFAHKQAKGTLLPKFNTVLSFKDKYSGVYELCTTNIALNNCTTDIGNFAQSFAQKDYRLMIRAELHIKFEMNFPKNFDLSSLNKNNVNLSMDKENSAVTFAYPFEDKYVYKLGTNKLIPGKPIVYECDNLKDPIVNSTSMIVPVQPSKNFLKVKHHYDVELNLYCKLSTNEVAESDKKTVYVITGNEDSCGFCKFENLAPATNYSLFMSLIRVDNEKEYGKSSENTVYTFITNTTEPEALPETFYYIQNGIKPSVSVIWNSLSRRLAGGKTVAYKITEKHLTTILNADISCSFEDLYSICKFIRKGLDSSIRVESTWKSDLSFNFSLLRDVPDQINLPANWAERQPENILLTAYVDRSMNNNKVIIVWSHWVMNATEYILILCRNQDSFLKGCTNNMESFKIPRNESLFEYSIKMDLTETVMNNFSVGVSVKFKDDFMSGLLFSPCVFKQKNLHFNGMKGDNAIENIKTKIRGKILHSIVNLKKNPCELDIFFTYVVIYFCVSKNDVCIEECQRKKFWIKNKSTMTFDLGISSSKEVLLWGKVGSHLGESTNSSNYQKTANFSGKLSN
ncbi:DgyrCDS13362 [Dimorphilus gyrociliatus]|uniref:DgyrCDS13362 n=1 Tax=Dimorphilus gyrociliatus TaxID=2664684 RepID=A0A7I8WAG4_9ANNE|nr:DgyrCDS13362 [Dimorphilus gyrociliatus]